MTIYYSIADGNWTDDIWATDPNSTTPSGTYPGAAGPDDTAVIRHDITLDLDNLVLHGDPNVYTTYYVNPDRLAIYIGRVGSIGSTVKVLRIPRPANLETTLVGMGYIYYFYGISPIEAGDDEVGLYIGTEADPLPHNAVNWRFVKVNNPTNNRYANGVIGNRSRQFNIFRVFGRQYPRYRTKVVGSDSTYTELYLEEPIKVETGDKVWVTDNRNISYTDLFEVVEVRDSGATVVLDRAIQSRDFATNTTFIVNANRAVNIIDGKLFSGGGSWFTRKSFVFEIEGMGMPFRGYPSIYFLDPFYTGDSFVRNSMLYGYYFGLYPLMYESRVDFYNVDIFGRTRRPSYGKFANGFAYSLGYQHGFQWEEIENSKIYGYLVIPQSISRSEWDLVNGQGSVYGTLDFPRHPNYYITQSRLGLDGIGRFYIRNRAGNYNSTITNWIIMGSKIHLGGRSPSSIGYLTTTSYTYTFLFGCEDENSNPIPSIAFGHQAIIELDTVNKLSGDASLKIQLLSTTPTEFTVMPKQGEPFVFSITWKPSSSIEKIKVTLYDKNGTYSAEFVPDGSGDWQKDTLVIPDSDHADYILVRIELSGVRLWIDRIEYTDGWKDTSKMQVPPMLVMGGLPLPYFVYSADVWNFPKTGVTNPEGMGRVVLDMDKGLKRHDVKMTGFKFM